MAKKGKHKQCKTCKCSKPHECFPNGGAHCSSCSSRGMIGTYGGMYRGGGGGTVGSTTPSQPSTSTGGSSGGTAVGAGVGETATMQ